MVGRVLAALQLYSEIDTEQQCGSQKRQAPGQKGRVSDDCKQNGLPSDLKMRTRSKRLTNPCGESGKKFGGIRSKLSESSHKKNLKLSAFAGCIIVLAFDRAGAIRNRFLVVDEYRDTEDERDGRDPENHLPCPHAPEVKGAISPCRRPKPYPLATEV